MATTLTPSETGVLPPGTTPERQPATKRYLALDAFRGFIMLILAAEGFGFSALRGDPTWGRVARWFNHVPWEGRVFRDTIQTSFMFMVGVAMPFALARRTELGATPQQTFRHVLWRSIRLVILSQILIWVSAGRIKPQLINVLSQIAFTYFLTYLIMRWPWRYQALTAFVLLAGWTALLFAFPGPDGPFSPRNHIALRAHRAIFRSDYDPAYSTLNFPTSTVWTLAGPCVARWAISNKSHRDNLNKLAAGMGVTFALAFAIHPWIPFINQVG